MKHFNPLREIDLAGYLPPVLQNIREMHAVMSTETPEIQALWQACEGCMNNQFVSEATEKGIARREKMLNITPYATDTLEDRRFRVLARYNEARPYTRKSLAVMLSALCGDFGYELGVKNFIVTVKLAYDFKRYDNAVKELLERVLPLNMAYSVLVVYDGWQRLENSTWGDLRVYTWDDARGLKGGKKLNGLHK